MRGGERSEGWEDSSSAVNATLRGAKGLRYLWRQLNSQGTHDLFARRARGRARLDERDRERVVNLCVPFYFIPDDPLLYELRGR